MHRQADKNGFRSIVERFDNDVEFTLSSVRQDFDREFLRVQDVLVHGALPNVGRSQAQRSLGVGAHGSGSGYDRPERLESVARLLYFNNVGAESCSPAALRAGLIDAVTDDPRCIMWLGVAYSIRSCVDVFLAQKIIDRIQAFSEIVWIDATLGYSADEWAAWLRQHLAGQAVKQQQVAQLRPKQTPAISQGQRC